MRCDWLLLSILLLTANAAHSAADPTVMDTSRQASRPAHSRHVTKPTQRSSEADGYYGFVRKQTASANVLGGEEKCRASDATSGYYSFVSSASTSNSGLAPQTSKQKSDKNSTGAKEVDGYYASMGLARRPELVRSNDGYYESMGIVSAAPAKQEAIKPATKAKPAAKVRPLPVLAMTPKPAKPLVKAKPKKLELVSTRKQAREKLAIVPSKTQPELKGYVRKQGKIVTTDQRDSALWSYLTKIARDNSPVKEPKPKKQKRQPAVITAAAKPVIKPVATMKTESKSKQKLATAAKPKESKPKLVKPAPATTTTPGRSGHAPVVAAIKLSKDAIARLNPDKSITLQHGDAIVSAANQVRVLVGENAVTLEKNTIAFISNRDNCVKVRNLYDMHSGSLKSRIMDRDFEIHPGQELVTAANFAKLNDEVAVDSVERRALKSYELPNGNSVLTCEYSPITLIKSCEMLKQLRDGNTDKDKVILGRVLKMAACLQIATAGHGGYLAVTK